MYHPYPTADLRTNQANGSDDSSSNATKRRAGAATVVVVGSSASIEKNASDDEQFRGGGASELNQEDEEEPGPLILVPMDEYRPGLTVRVVDRLPAPIVVQLLRLPNDETVPVLERPDEYTGYVVRVEFRSDLVYATMIVFSRESLDTDATYRFEGDAQAFSTQLHLLRATARRVEPDE